MTFFCNNYVIKTISGPAMAFFYYHSNNCHNVQEYRLKSAQIIGRNLAKFANESIRSIWRSHGW